MVVVFEGVCYWKAGEQKVAYRKTPSEQINVQNGWENFDRASLEMS